MVTGPRYPKDRITDDEEQWLEQASAPDPGPRTRCCARCRRGVIPGQFPCGLKLACRCHE
jgi:hypothetical protein